MHTMKPSRTRLLTRASACRRRRRPAASTAAWAADPQVSLKTSMGEIVLELDQEKAPKSVDNFLQYVKSGFYKGTIFHRVIDGFMIQGGGMDAKLAARPVANRSRTNRTTACPTSLHRRDGARINPIRPPRSSSSTWSTMPASIIPNMDGSGYTVFGKVVKGQEVVDKIKACWWTTCAACRTCR
jgi:peptidyl-prolyl cis-trans isomerase A (cyclophilin A)